MGTDEHLRLTDNEVLAALLDASRTPAKAGHDPARRIMRREHYRLAYDRNPADQKKTLEAVRLVYDALVQQFGPGAVRRDPYAGTSPGGINFPVQARDGRIVSSMYLSETLGRIPTFSVDYVFIDPDLRDKATRWLSDNRDQIIAAPETPG